MPAGRPGACSPPPNARELLQGGNGPLGFAGGSWCLLAGTALTPLNLGREKRQKWDMFIQGLCPNLSDLPEKTLCCTLDQTGTAKPLNSATGSAELGKKLPSTNKLLQHCLLFHFSWHFPLIQLGLAPVENSRQGTTSSSELAIPASLLLGQ